MTTRFVDDRPSSLLIARVRTIPAVSTLAGSACALLPMVTNAPVLPPFGLLMLCAWRLLRPEIWPAWVGFLLGLGDDLMSGQLLGTSATLWTFCLLAFDLVDTRLLWRDYWVDWALASVAVILCLGGGWLSAASIGSGGALVSLVPQGLLSILCLPLIMRLCADLDRWRLRL